MILIKVWRHASSSSGSRHQSGSSMLMFWSHLCPQSHYNHTKNSKFVSKGQQGEREKCWAKHSTHEHNSRSPSNLSLESPLPLLMHKSASHCLKNDHYKWPAIALHCSKCTTAHHSISHTGGHLQHREGPAHTWCTIQKVTTPPTMQKTSTPQNQNAKLQLQCRNMMCWQGCRASSSWALQGCCIWKTQGNGVTLQRGQNIFCIYLSPPGLLHLENTGP